MKVEALVASLLLVLGNGFFVGAEFALIATRRTQIEPLARHSRRARIALRAMHEIPLMIAGAQLGITMCSILLGALAEPAIATAITGPLESIGVEENLIHPVAFLIALAIVIYLHTVLGEMVPKNISIARPEKALLWLAPPLWWFCVVTGPLLHAMKWLSRRFLSLFGISAADEVKTAYTAEELTSLASESATEGLLNETDRARVTGALTLARHTAGEIMCPWNQVYYVPEFATPAEVEQLAVRTSHSRYPVVGGQQRILKGFVHVKDIVTLPPAVRKSPLPPKVIRPLAVVQKNVSLADLLVRMRRDRSHMVLVKDGDRPVGIASLEDVLEALVGSGV